MNRDIRSKYDTYSGNTPAGNGGIIMLMDKKYSKIGAATLQQVPKECSGYLLHASIGAPYTATLHIVGVYVPGDTKYATARPVIYQHMTKILQEAPATDTVLLAGDWNATLNEGDREHGLTTMARTHAEWAQSHPRI